MSTRQYIGARYVPKFFENPNGSAEWIKETSYEALTIVTYLGNSYTSKKPVPINTDITNSEYWAPTGNYNEQLQNYIRKVDSVTNDVNTLKMLENYVTLEMFGDINDDRNNNQSIFIQAINYASKNNKPILLLEKTYKITGSITLPNNVSIIGLDKLKSVIDFNTASCILFQSGDSASKTGNTYKLTKGFVLKNVTLIGSYNVDTVGMPTQHSNDTTACIMGFFMGSYIDNINIQNCIRGIALSTPNFIGTDYQTYSYENGDIRTFSNISIYNCYDGAYLHEADSDFTNLRVMYIYNKPLDASSSTLTNVHIWMFGNSPIAGNCRISNLEIESPFWFRDIPINCLKITSRCIINNLYVWNYYKPENYQYTVNYAPIISVTGSDGVQINGYQFGSNEAEKIVKTPLCVVEKNGSAYCIITSFVLTYNFTSWSPINGYSNIFDGNIVVTPYSVGGITDSNGNELMIGKRIKPRYLSLTNKENHTTDFEVLTITKTTGDTGNIVIKDELNGRECVAAWCEQGWCQFFVTSANTFITIRNASDISTTINNTKVTVHVLAR
jgi:hypothetical protein